MTDMVDTSRGVFAVDEHGDPGGPPLMFVAGLGDGRGSWSDVLGSFAEYRCITFDNRGIGESVCTPGPYTIGQLAEDTHELAIALDLTGVTVIGSSMGGAICQEWLLTHPEMILRAVLTNTWAEYDPYCGLLFEHWKALADKGSRDELAQAASVFSFSPEFFRRHPDVDWSDGSELNLVGFAAAAAACRDHDALGRLGDVVQPILVVVGKHDILTRPEFSIRLVDTMLNATLGHVRTGHMTFQEAPDEWSNVVLNWLRTTDLSSVDE